MSQDQLAQFQEMYAWFLERKEQQLSLPVDDASKNALGALTYAGATSKALTTTISIPPGGGSASVAVPPTGFIVVSVEGALRTVATYD